MAPVMESKRREKIIEDMNKPENQQYKRKIVKNKTMTDIFLCSRTKIVSIPSLKRTFRFTPPGTYSN